MTQISRETVICVSEQSPQHCCLENDTNSVPQPAAFVTEVPAAAAARHHHDHQNEDGDAPLFPIEHDGAGQLDSDMLSFSCEATEGAGQSYSHSCNGPTEVSYSYTHPLEEPDDAEVMVCTLPLPTAAFVSNDLSAWVSDMDDSDGSGYAAAGALPRPQLLQVPSFSGDSTITPFESAEIPCCECE